MFKLCAFLLIFAAFSVTAFPRYYSGSFETDVIELRLRRQANPAKGKPNQPPTPSPQNQGGGQNGGNQPPPPPQGNGNPPRPTRNPGSNCQNGSNPPPPPPPRGNGRPGRRPPPPPPPRGGHGHGGCNNYPETTSQRPEEVTSASPLDGTTNVPEVSPTYDPIAIGSSTDNNVGTSDPIDYSLNPVTADAGTTSVFVLSTTSSITDGTTGSPVVEITTASPLESQTVSGIDFTPSNDASSPPSLSSDLPELLHTTSEPLLADGSTSSSDNYYSTTSPVFVLGSTTSVSNLPEAGSTQSPNTASTSDATPTTDQPINYSTLEPSNPTSSVETRSPCSPYPEATTGFGVTWP